jgi:putative MFS transporter
MLQSKLRITQIIILSALGLFVDGYDLFMMSIAMPLIMQDWHIPLTMAGILGAVAPIGAIVGAFSFGYLLDKFGRKKILVLNMAFLSIFTLLTAFAPNLTCLIILRFLTGVFIGADYPASATYMS